MTKYHPNLQLKDFVKVYENVLDLDICKNIIEKVDYSQFERARVQEKNEAVINKNRNCYIKRLDNEFDQKVFESIGKVLQLYEKDFPAFYYGSDGIDTGYDHLLYKGEEKGEYVTHIDHMNAEPRLISISILLNDEFDGGDFSFFDGYVVKNKVGGALVFPSNFMFPHGVLPVSNGDRHAIVTWVR
jgi:predicted 2-oxoglutarate/Fe(II)-dependent dioxygenase YbiX